MKKLFILFVFLCLVLSFGCDKAKDQAKESKSPLETKSLTIPKGIVDQLPDNTLLLIKLSSIEETFKYLSVTENSVFGEPIEPEKMNETIEKIGINPLKIEDLKSVDIDTSKQLGIGFTEFIINEKDPEADPSIIFFVFVPVTNDKAKDKLMDYINKKDETSKVKITNEADYSVLEDKKGIKVYFTQKGNYLFIAMGNKSDAKPTIEAIVSGKTSLPKSKLYQDVATKIDSSEELFIYANGQKLIENNSNVIAKLMQKSQQGSPMKTDMETLLQYLQDYEGIGFNWDLANKDLLANILVNLKKGSKLLDLVKDVKYNKDVVFGFKENPGILISLGLNVKEYFNYLMTMFSKDQAEQVKQSLEMSKQFGIDMEKDLFENLAGNINLCIYDGGSISMVNYNSLLTMNVKDEKKMIDVFEKLAALPNMKGMISKEKIDNLDVYKINTGTLFVFAGVQNNNLIVTIGKPMFEKAIQGNPKSGFLSNIKDDKLSETLNLDSTVMYLKVEEIMKALNNFGLLNSLVSDPAKKDQITNTINQFDYLLLYGNYTGSSGVSQLYAKTNFTKPFLNGIKDIKDSFKK